VLLVDLDPAIYRIWKWILTECTAKDIEALPELELGESLDACKQLTDVERDILGWTVSISKHRGSTVSKWAEGRITKLKTRLLYYIPRIKHWKVLNCSYQHLKTNHNATWFLDPPYNNLAGKNYKYHNIDYAHLARWAKQRNGQVIVCENNGADWLPFEPLPRGPVGMYSKSFEAVWTKDA